MYHAHWGLSGSPLRGSRSGRFYRSATHDEALARLSYLVDEARQLGLLAGPLGTGKTTVLHVFAADCRGAGMAAVAINCVGLDAAELLAAVAEGLELPPGGRAGAAELWRAIGDRLREFALERRRAVLLFDDADSAESASLTAIARLARLDPSPDSTLTLVLAAEPQNVGALAPAIRELADLRVCLDPWEPDETAGYVRQTLAEAGGRPDIFSAAALDRLHERAGGVPRQVRHLADLALLAGAADGRRQIDAELIDSVSEELALLEV